MPPETEIYSPVIQAASSDARNTAAFAISLGCPLCGYFGVMVPLVQVKQCHFDRLCSEGHHRPQEHHFPCL